MLTLRLMRFGAKKKPSYRIVVIDSRRARQSKALDIIGNYDPLKEPVDFRIDQEKAKYWLSKGARPSQTVQSLLHTISKTEKPRNQDSKS